MPSFGTSRCQESDLIIVVGIPSIGFFAENKLKFQNFANTSSSIIIQCCVKIGKSCCRVFARYS